MLCVTFVFVLQAQQDTLVPIPQLIPVTDTLIPSPAGLELVPASSDTLDTPNLGSSSSQSLGSPTSGLPGQRPEGGVLYGARDSTISDLVNQKIHLYGQAYVQYDNNEIKADYIILDLTTNEVEALTAPQQEQKPLLSTAQQSVQADHIRFNLDTQQGIVHGARIQQDEYYIHGATTKFVTAENDSFHIDNVIYNKNALLTTCDHDEPHWGIRTSRLKIIPEKLAVVGPFDLELGGIPTPLALPFAFAPLFSIGQSTSGLLFPDQDPIVVDDNLGIGTRGIGYYFALSEKFDLKLTADIYTRGTFVLNAASNYRKRYKYTGNFAFRFSREKQDIASDVFPNIQRAYSIRLNHRQDPKAHPYRTIGGSLNFTINDFDRRNFSDVESQLNSQINSNFSYAYRLNSKTNFSASIQHSQSTQTRRINFTLPELQLRVSRFFPFKSSSSTSANEKWYEKINAQYAGRFQNRVNTTDTILFSRETLDLFRFGLSQDLDLNASYKLLEYFNFNTTVTYDEFNYFQTYEAIGVDTSGNQIGGIRRGLETLRELNLNAGISTNVFGTVLFKKGYIRGLRHQITPTIGLGYAPSTEGRLGVLDTLGLNLDPSIIGAGDLEFNPFRGENGETLIFSRNLVQGGARITYSLSNTLEGKLWSKKDSTERKFNVFNSLNFSGSYNLQADSLNWEVITVSGAANILGGLTRVSLRGDLDAYVRTSDNRRINTTVLSAEGRLLRWDQFTLTLATALTLSDIRDIFKGEYQIRGRSRSQRRDARDPDAPEELFSWFEGFRIDHNFSYGFRSTGQDEDEFEVQAHNIRLTTGNIPLSDKWGMTIGNLSYDIRNKRWVYPSFTLTRDLHCWQMRISWQPQRNTYTFYIGVAASPFGQYLKYETGRNRFQGVNVF